ncbi:TPA: hypothetical protein ACT2TO_001581 [Citrobacter braakii]
MNISTREKLHVLGAFVEAFPESITDDAWRALVDEVGNVKEVFGYIALLHDDGYLKGKVSFVGSEVDENHWDINLPTLRVTSQGHELWRKLLVTSLGH